MSEDAIRLVNEDGVIKGLDPETGEQVPVEFDDLRSSSHRTEAVKADEVEARPDTPGGEIAIGDDLSLPVDHEGHGLDSSLIRWDTPGTWEYDSGEFHSLLETSYRDGGGYGVSGHWQILSTHHYGPAFGLPNRGDVQCPIHVYGREPDAGAAEFSITFGDYHAPRQRVWLSKSGGSMLEESSPAAELSVLANYRHQNQVTHLALTPNYLREERPDGEEITEADTPITPGTFRFRGAYWDDGLETVRMLQFTPAMETDDHAFHVKLQIEDDTGELVETARIDDTGTWTVQDTAITGRLRPPGVETEADLPDEESAREPELVGVSDEQRWYTYTEADGWIRSPPPDP